MYCVLPLVFAEGIEKRKKKLCFVYLLFWISKIALVTMEMVERICCQRSIDELGGGCGRSWKSAKSGGDEGFVEVNRKR